MAPAAAAPPRTWRGVLWPDGAPLWLALAGNTSLALAVASLVLVVLPGGLARRLPKRVRRVRHWLLGGLRRMLELSAKGPFVRVIVACGKRLCRGRLASRCQPPRDFRAKPVGCAEAHVFMSPQIPMNLFHEESYVLAWRCKDEAADAWRERVLSAADVQGKGGRLRVFVGGLPEQRPLVFRVRAENSRGRSEWSEEAAAETFAAPSAEGGLWGPLGPAAGGSGGTSGARYAWTQTKSEVGIRIPLDPSRKAKEIKVKPFPTRLEIRCARGVNDGSPEDGEVLLAGPLPKKVKVDEVFWSIEEEDEALGRHMAVQMAKAEAMERWPCLIDAPGHPKIDTALLQFRADGVAGLDIWE